jgi:hypothetical protein
MRARTWCVLLLAIVSVCAITLQEREDGSRVGPVGVFADGTLVYAADVSDITEAYERTFTTARGAYNVVRFEPGAVYVVRASCPDQYCVAHGALGTFGAAPIVCAPNRLVVRALTAPESAYDAVTGG